MTNLSIMLGVWNDLESNYLNYAKTHKGLSRLDYLKKLVAFEGDEPNLTALRTILADELAGYSDEETEQYTALFNLITAVTTNLRKQEDSISDLNEFMAQKLSCDIEEEESVFSIEDYNFFSTDNYTNVVDSLRNGIFSDTVRATEAGSESYLFDPNNDKYRVLMDKQQIANYVAMFNSGYVKQTDAALITYAIAFAAVRDEDYSAFSVALPGLYEKTARTIGFGKYKAAFKSKEVITIPPAKLLDGTIITSEIKAYKAKVKGYYREQTIYFIME